MDEAAGRYWIEYGSRLRWAKTISSYLKILCDGIGPDTFMGDLSDTDVAKYTQIKVDAGLKPGAVNRQIAVLRGVHKRAKKKWGIEVKSIDWADHKLREPRERVRWITQDEAVRLIAVLPDHIAIAVEWSLYTGMRLAETYSLTWESIDLAVGTVTFIAKGGHKRTLPLSVAASNILIQAPRTGRFVFDGTNRRRLFEAAIEKANLDDFRWHDLRHTHATWLRQNNVPLEVVQRSLGHVSITTTARYAHVDDSELQDALQELHPITTNTKKIIPFNRKKSTG